MIINQYWEKHEEVLPGIDPQTGIVKPQPYRFIAGSMISPADAKKRAIEKAHYVKQLIQGEAIEQPEDYHNGIQEEIIKKLDSQHIVTINRYGADILNVANTLLIDIDCHNFSDRLSFFTKLKYRFAFGQLRHKQEDPLPLHHIRQVANQPQYRHLTFRIYQTAAGYRVWVLGETFDPHSKRSESIMAAFGSDPLYQYLCKKQGCYRARLTPKPSRIHMKGHRVVFPFRSEDQNKEHENWRQHYLAASKAFAVCHLLDVIGPSAPENFIVQFHDVACKANQKHLPLA